MIKVSIIVPVYNVEKYLRQCLDSAINQTMKEIEIICVNDGSTDSSFKILEEMEQQDSRIRVISKANSGYGNTMNMGIDAAEGKYIVFLESDDYILPSMCEEMFELCEKYDLDIVKADYYEFKSDADNTYSRYMHTSYHNNYHQVLNSRADSRLFFTAMYTWTCMYSREFLNEYNIRHNETPGASFQDNGFWFQTMMYADRLYLLDKAFYMYRQDNPNSSIHNKAKVYAFSEEYRFIRDKISKFAGDKSDFINICAFFNLNHNMNQLVKVADEYIPELIALICKEFKEYTDRREWQINKVLNWDFLRRLFICMTQPEMLEKSIKRYHEEKLDKEKIIEKYDTIIIYGVGSYGRRMQRELYTMDKWSRDIICAVTSVNNAKIEVEDVKLQEISNLVAYTDEALVVLCVKPGTKAYTEMRAMAEGIGFKHICDLEDVATNDIWTMKVKDE